MNKQNKYLILFSLLFFYFLLYIFELNIIKFKDNNNFMRFNLSKEFIKIYSTLFFTARDRKASIPNYNYTYIKNYNFKKKKGLCICTIGKKENIYAREFIDYYKKLGFNKVIIFDNNDIGGEKFEDILNDYIKGKYVEIIDIRGLISVQIPVLNYCYEKYHKLYDWIAFFDFDEYLFINGTESLNNYIYNKRFEKCQSILFNWYFYDDNDLDKYDKRKVLERFKRPKYKVSTVKSMVRGDIKNLIITSSHITGININYFCDSNGKRVFPQTIFNINYSNIYYKAFIKHFYTKTAEEFCNKIIKGDVQFHRNQPNYLFLINNKINFFFSINNITSSKLKILKKCLNLDINNLKKRIVIISKNNSLFN